MRWLALLCALTTGLCLADGPTLRVGFGTHKPPYVFEGEQRGLEFDIVAAAMEAAGLSMQVEHAPMERLQLMLSRRQLDAMATTNVKGSVEAHLSQPYLQYSNMAVALSSRQLRIERISDLSRYSVSAFQRARFLLGDEFRQMAQSNPRYREEAQQITRNRLLYSGRIDVAIGDPRIFRYLDALVAEQVDTSQALTWYPLFPPSEYQVGFLDPQLRDRFDEGLAIIRESGVYADIQRRYADY